MKLGRNPILDNPHYGLEAFGLQNPMVREAIRLGAWGDATCWKCRGARTLVRQYLDKNGDPAIEKCDACGGVGYRRNAQDDRIFEEDCGPGASLMLALQHFRPRFVMDPATNTPARRPRR